MSETWRKDPAHEARIEDFPHIQDAVGMIAAEPHLTGSKHLLSTKGLSTDLSHMDTALGYNLIHIWTVWISPLSGL